MSLIDIIKSAKNPPHDTDLEKLREYIVYNPREINTVDSHGKTPCHYAVTNFPLLVILVLEGKAILPQNLTDDESLNKKITTLKNEQFRIRKKYFVSYHLHEMISASAHPILIKKQCRTHPNEIHELSHFGRNACHLAAIMNKSEYFEIFAKYTELGQDLITLDMEGKTPLDLATNADTKITIRKFLVAYQTTAVNNNGSKESSQRSVGILKSIQSGIGEISSSMRKIISPPRARTDKSPENTSLIIEPLSPRRNELYPRASLSPRNNAKLQPPNSFKQRGILKIRNATEDVSAIDYKAKPTSMVETIAKDSPEITSQSYFVSMPPINLFITNELRPPANAALALASSDVASETATTPHIPPQATTPYELKPPVSSVESVTTTDILPSPNIVKNTITQKQIRFADDCHPIKLSAEAKSNQSNNNQTNPFQTQAQHKQDAQTEHLVTIIKNDNIDAFQKYYKESGTGPDYKLPGFGRPYIIQAFLSNAGQIFIFLLQENANLDARTSFGKNLTDYIFEDKTNERIAFLKHIQERLIAKMSTSRINLSLFQPELTSNTSVNHSLPVPDKQVEKLKNRKGLMNENTVKYILPKQILEKYEIAKAIDFFDAMAQILNANNITNPHTDKSLRKLCSDFYRLNKRFVNKLNTTQHGKSYADREDYLFVQYTAEDCEKDNLGRNPILGVPEIEGIILCNQLSLDAICVIEISEIPNTKLHKTTFYLVNKEAYNKISERHAKILLQNASIPTLIMEHNQNNLHIVPLLKISTGFVKASTTQTNDRSRLKNAQKRFDQIETAFMQKLKARGLTVRFKRNIKILASTDISEIGKKHEQSIELVQLVYDLCIGKYRSPEIDSAYSDEMSVFDERTIQEIVVGLLANTGPHVIVKLLTDLFPHFFGVERLIVLFIIKEIIARDRFHSCYHSKQFCDDTLPAFFNASKEFMDDFRPDFQEMIRLQKKIDHPFVRAANKLETFISKYDNTKQSVSTKDHKLLADQLRDLTNQFLRTFRLSELVNLAFSKRNCAELAPTVVGQISLFNKISQFFTIGILQQHSDKDRRAYIKLCITTIDELINGNPGDLNSAMAISSALENRIVTRYLNEFQRHDSDTFSMWENAQNALNCQKNFAALRKIMDTPNRLIYPYLGIITRDLTFGSENTHLISKVSFEGKEFLKLIKLQGIVWGNTSCLAESNLNFLLNQQKEMTDDELELLAMRAHPTPLRLFVISTLSHLSKMIEIYIEKNLTLKVIDAQKKQIEGHDAIQSVYSWLKEKVAEGSINKLADIDIFITKLKHLPNASDSVEFFHREFKRWLKCQPAEAAYMSKSNHLTLFSRTVDRDQSEVKKGKERVEDIGGPRI